MRLKISIENEELIIDLNSNIQNEIEKFIHWGLDIEKNNKKFRVSTVRHEEYVSCYCETIKNYLMLQTDNVNNTIRIVLDKPIAINNIFIEREGDTEFVPFEQFMNIVNMTYKYKRHIYDREIGKTYTIGCKSNSLNISYIKKQGVDVWKLYSITIAKSNNAEA